MTKYGPKIKISSDLLEILYTSQFEGTEYEIEIDILYLNTNLFDILYLNTNFKQLTAKIKISSDLLKNVCTSQFEGTSNIK